MKKVWINGIEVQDFSDNEALPSVIEMINVVRVYIFKKTGKLVSIKLNLKNENMELLLLEKAYRYTIQFT